MGALGALGRWLGTGVWRSVKIVVWTALLIGVVVAIPYVGIRAASAIADSAGDTAPAPAAADAEGAELGFATVDELAFAVAANGTPCDGLVPFDAAAAATTAGTPEARTCTIGAARVWLLLYPSVAAREAAVDAGVVTGALCPGTGLASVDLVAGGNWVYAAAADPTVAPRAATSLGVTEAPSTLPCTAPTEG